MPPLVSVISTACNQGDWVRDTVPRIRESLGDWPHEVIIVDDQSVDGCCHGLDRDVLILRPETRHGVSASRRLAMRNASGEILLFTDPHCHYPEHVLRDLVCIAAEEKSIVLPATTSMPVSRKPRFGGFLDESDRGLKISHSRSHPAKWPALLGTIYAVQRDVYDSLGGWPELPGVWGYSEQALSLMAWFSGVPINIATQYVCNHEHYHPHKGTRFSYRVPQEHQAGNGHWVHAAFFPETYESHWAPMLKKRFRDKESHWACLSRRGWESKDPEVGRRTIKKFRNEIQQRAVRTEKDFYQYVLGYRMNNGRKKKERDVPLVDKKWLDRQRTRSKPSADEVVSKRQDRAIKWFINHVPGCVKGRKILDMGTRSGYVVNQLDKMGALEVEGIEVVPETAEHACKELGRNVVTGDMRYMPYKNGQWHCVLCIHALEHIPDPAVAIAELLRVLTRGGWFLIVVPIEQEPILKYAHYTAFPNARTLEDMVKKHPVDHIRVEVKGLSPKPKEEILLMGRKKR